MFRPRTLRTSTALALALVLPACAGNDPGSDPDGDPVTGGGAAMDVTVTTDRSTYDQGDDVVLTLTARNTTDEAVTLHFTSSQRYDFQVEDASGETAWTWSADRGFAQMLGEETFAPGEEAVWTETVDASLPPGEYTAVGMVVNRSGPLVDRTPFTVR